MVEVHAGLGDEIARIGRHDAKTYRQAVNFTQKLLVVALEADLVQEPAHLAAGPEPRHLVVATAHIAHHRGLERLALAAFAPAADRNLHTGGWLAAVAPGEE